MRAVDLVRKKRDGGELTQAEIEWLVQGKESGQVADYQWSALLMAIVCRGMNPAEASYLTRSMIDSGQTLDLSKIAGVKVDKHSTGGVGDKTSLILAPIAAAAGVPVPMVSGRGLGHTGGTLDKLESIPGFRTGVTTEEFLRILDQVGLVLAGQTAEIAPADKWMYALRDATATVESVALITASILSKKFAEGIDALVMDVKVGDGAFMKTLDQARELAQSICRVGGELGKTVKALITRMDQPLGLAIGNAVEVQESIDCLRGQGPADLMNLSIELAAEMIVMGGKALNLDQARDLAWRTIHNGSALEKFRQVIEVQGGDPKVVDDPLRLPQAQGQWELKANRSGVVKRMSAFPIGLILCQLGAGRERVDSLIDPSVGLILSKKVGDQVRQGETLAILRANHRNRAELALAELSDAIDIDDDLSSLSNDSLIVERLESSNECDSV